MINQIHPLVSVVIAFLNEERFLEEAIQSVLKQTYDHWELILVDDGSTDKSLSIAKAHAQRYPAKVYYLDHEGHVNKGLSASRNAGIKQAKGDLVAFLDADDVWQPSKLEKQVKIFGHYPEIAMVAEASEYWYTWINPYAQDILIPVGAPQNKVYHEAELIRYLYPLSEGAAPCPSGLMLTKAALDRAGGFEESFEKEFQLYEDQAFLHKIYLKEKVFISSDCQNRYRQREGSIVQKVVSEGQYHRVRRFFLEWLERYIIMENIEEKQTHELLRRALLPYRHPSLYFLTSTLPTKMRAFAKRGYKKLIK